MARATTPLSLLSRTALLSCAVATLLALTGCGGGGDSATAGTGGAQLGAPAVESCLHSTSVRRLAEATEVSCSGSHEAQVYALIGLPKGLRDPGVKAQVTRALPALRCPPVTAWAGYRGTVPVGLLQTWKFPTKAQIRSGARWAACVAIVAPGPDHDTLKATAGSFKDRLARVRNPLPELGRCAPAHTNTQFTPSFCQPGSRQWLWLGAHPKSTGPFPGLKHMKQVATYACRNLAALHGRGAAFVYYPHTATGWAAAHADWSCWMPVAEVKG